MSLNPLAPEYNPIAPYPTTTARHHHQQPTVLYSSTPSYSTYTTIQYPTFYPAPTNYYYYLPPQNPPPTPRPVTTVSDNNKISDYNRQEEETRPHEIIPLNWDLNHTTVMIKNIPYDCSRRMLIEMLDGFCMMENRKPREEGSSSSSSAAYDFLYLPVDFRNGNSRGFAFVNFTNATTVKSFYNTFHLCRWNFVSRCKWSKEIEVVTAKIQGKEDLMKHFSDSVFQCDSDEYLPVMFSPARDGSGQRVKMNIVGNRGALFLSRR